MVIRRCISIAMMWCGALFTSAFAATPAADSTTKIQCISTLASWRASDSEQQETWNCLREWSAARGVALVNKAEWAVWIDTAPVMVNGLKALVLNIGLGHTLPDEAMEAGKKAEAFYAFMTPEQRSKLPAEGKWVRETMTEEFLSQFVMPIEQRLEVIKISELQSRVSAVLDELVLKRIRAH